MSFLLLLLAMNVVLALIGIWCSFDKKRNQLSNTLLKICGGIHLLWIILFIMVLSS